MRITPLEIRKHPFRTVFRGLDPDQVYSFLKQIADEIEDLRSENNQYGTRVKELSTEMERYRHIEATLNETLLTAQRATDDARANAQKEAELIIKDAQIRADRYESEMKDRVQALHTELGSLEAQKEGFLMRYGSLLRDQVKFIDVIRKQGGNATLKTD